VTGGHLRTDKVAVGPGYNTGLVSFAGADRQRLLRGGGNVWQHLRSFRKRLFDAVPDECLRMQTCPDYCADCATKVSCTTSALQATAAAATGVSGGSKSAAAAGTGAPVAAEASASAAVHLAEGSPARVTSGPGSVGYYYELANDWAFSVPMAELATKAGVLPLAVYLYEPSWPKQDRCLREHVIGEGVMLGEACRELKQHQQPEIQYSSWLGGTQVYASAEVYSLLG